MKATESKYFYKSHLKSNDNDNDDSPSMTKSSQNPPIVTPNRRSSLPLSPPSSSTTSTKGTAGNSRGSFVLLWIVVTSISFLFHFQIQETNQAFSKLTQILKDRQHHYEHMNLYDYYGNGNDFDKSRDIIEDHDHENVRRSPSRHPKFAVGSFVDGPEHIFGVYSIMNQMKKFNMSTMTMTATAANIGNGNGQNTQQHATTQETIPVDQVVVIPTTYPKDHPIEYKLLKRWIGKQHIYKVPKNYIQNRLHDKDLWAGVFNKLWLWNLTHYDKLIVLDVDIMIRTNINHWFVDYPTPCATQAKDNIEWNSGAMVIQPNTTIFNRMVEVLPQVKKFNPNKHSRRDTMNSGHGQQGFLSAFFTQASLTKEERMKTMPTEAAVLITNLHQEQFRYFTSFRRHIFETVHFTTAKPWRKASSTDPTSDPVECDFRREYATTFQGITKYDAALQPVRDEYLSQCP